MLKNLVLAITFTILSISSSHSAAVFVEPIFSYTRGTFSLRDTPMFSTKTHRDFKFEGLNYGLRGGVDFHNIQLGAEYILNHLKASKSDPMLDSKSFKVSEFSAFLGYRIGYFRPYFAYIIDSKVHDADIKDGDGYKLGLSFYAPKNIVVSLEYKHIDFSDFLSTDNDIEAVSLLASFPFTFPF